MNDQNPSLEERSARISDIIEQIVALNEVIDRHKALGAEPSNTFQYLYMKSDFLEELNGILTDFRLNISEVEQAA